VVKAGPRAARKPQLKRRRKIRGIGRSPPRQPRRYPVSPGGFEQQLAHMPATASGDTNFREMIVAPGWVEARNIDGETDRRFPVMNTVGERTRAVGARERQIRNQGPRTTSSIGSSVPPRRAATTRFTMFAAPDVLDHERSAIGRTTMPDVRRGTAPDRKREIWLSVEPATRSLEDEGADQRQTGKLATIRNERRARKVCRKRIGPTRTTRMTASPDGSMDRV